MSDELLVSRDVYLKSGAHIGTKFKTKYMERFIYKTRQDGLSVFNISETDKRIREAINLLSHYEPEDILVVGKREVAWKPISVFAKTIGAKYIAGRYPPGMLTNPELKIYTEAKIVIVIDPFLDKNAINDAFKRGIPVVSICDTNNEIKQIDLVIPFNNKGRTSLSLLFWILTREYMLKKGMIKDENEFKMTTEDFMAEM